jgi:glutathione S-transferase
MKLYDSRLAPNPRRVRWFMAEKGIGDIEVIDVDLMTGAHKTPEYVARAGIAQAPALTMDDGTTITESLAICRYLESVYPTPNMFGRDAKEAAVIEMWTRRAEILAALPLMMAVRHGHPALAVLETQVPEVAANNRQQAERSLELFDRRLADSAWIGAERITIADGVLYIGMEFARMVRFKVPEDLPNLTRWQAAMRERASAKAGT